MSEHRNEDIGLVELQEELAGLKLTPKQEILVMVLIVRVVREALDILCEEDTFCNLTDDIKAIIKEQAKTLTQREVASKFGVSQSCVSRIVNA